MDRGTWAENIPAHIVCATNPERTPTETGQSFSYSYYDPVQIGIYTLQFWKVCSIASTNSAPVDTKKEKLCCQSYLPDGTSGLRLPQFSMSAKIPRTPRGQSPYQGRGRAVSAPLKHYPYVIFGNDDEPNWQFSIYREGEHIEPSNDFWLKDYAWVKQKPGPWMTQTFTKKELCDIIYDIAFKFDRTSVLSKEDVAKWIRPEQAQDFMKCSTDFF